MCKQAVEDCRGTFTPFVTSVDGFWHWEAEHFLERMLQKPFVQTCGFIRARLSFAITRAAMEPMPNGF